MLKVSILIPLYNSEHYIAETIQSALNQTYTNIEVIITDDGSTDNSYLIAKKFESDNVKVLQQTNKGASAARNLAFKNCTGDLIQYLDADDILHTNKIYSQVNKYLQLNRDCVLSGRWARFQDNLETAKWNQQATDKDYNLPIKWLIDSWNGNGMAQPGIWLTPRHLIEKAGSWNESLSLNDDGEFFSRILLNSKQIVYVSDSKVYYRSNISTSLSKSRTLKALHSELKSYRLYCRHTLKVSDSIELKRALGNNFLHFAYQYINYSKELSEKALQEFNKLCVGKPWPIGGRSFHKMSRIVGFRIALKLKSYLNIL